MFVFPSTIVASRHAAPAPLTRALSHLLNERHPATPSTEPRVPALDVVEGEAAYTLTLDMPGLSREDVNVNVHARRVSIEARAAVAPQAQEGERVLYRERATPHYARTVSLPGEVDPSTSTAKFDNGVLTLVLPKRVVAGPTTLNVA